MLGKSSALLYLPVRLDTLLCPERGSKHTLQSLYDSRLSRVTGCLEFLDLCDHSDDAFPGALASSCPFHWCLGDGWMMSRELHRSILENGAPTPSDTAICPSADILCMHTEPFSLPVDLILRARCRLKTVQKRQLS